MQIHVLSHFYSESSNLSFSLIISHEPHFYSPVERALFFISCHLCFWFRSLIYFVGPSGALVFSFFILCG